MHDEADRYLDLLVAIDPVDEGKPHHSVLDRLEEIDQNFIKTGNIPGYYVIQKDKRILKQQFELKNLDEYWEDYLSLKDKHKVAEGFGDIRYLLNQYHFEFRWEIVRLRPREEIKLFLDYHLNKFSGEPVDFINHIEFRVLPDMDGVARSEYPIYKLLIKEWVREKRTGLNSSGEAYLIDAVVSVCASFVDNVFVYREMQDENKYNTVLCGLLNQRFSARSWTAKDQSLGGSSNPISKRSRAGMAFRDFVILDNKNHSISAIECFRLKYVPTTHDSESEISEHLIKIFRNEPIGLSPLFVLVYCETKSFSQTWAKYLDYIGNIDFSQYHLINLNREVFVHPLSANIRIAKATHIRETSEIRIFHCFINMFP